VDPNPVITGTKNCKKNSDNHNNIIFGQIEIRIVLDPDRVLRVVFLQIPEALYPKPKVQNKCKFFVIFLVSFASLVRGSRKAR